MRVRAQSRAMSIVLNVGKAVKQLIWPGVILDKLYAEFPMTSRSGLLSPLILLVCAYAGDGVPPRGSGGDYPAGQTVDSVTIGAACVSASNAKQIFGEDLNKQTSEERRA